jgi:hypothetical protein
MSDDGLTLWSIFAVYGEGAKKGIKAHDRFNLVRAKLSIIEGSKWPLNRRQRERQRADLR